ncbi:hypothetical protein BKG96_00280 [Rodentibacter caecimuris]|uniref:Uncharacterized protein n=1 Tax=Rodentibacter caecimuris TaxID=1796644 RepID=A0A1V3KRK0_9PAST|nr:hypothetical protein BKG96_00280 [Rodentibacter heylii]
MMFGNEEKREKTRGKKAEHNIYYDSNPLLFGFLSRFVVPFCIKKEEHKRKNEGKKRGHNIYYDSNPLLSLFAQKINTPI